MMRNYTALPHEYLEEMQELSDAEYGRLIRALQKYSMSGEMEKLCGNERFYVKRVCNREDRYQVEFAEAAKKKSSSGKKGAENRWNGKDGNAIPSDSKNGNAISDDGKNSSAIFQDGKNGNTNTNTDTDTNTDTKADTEVLSPPVAGGDNTGAPAPAAGGVRDPVLAAVMSGYMNKINPTPSQICITELADYAHELGAEVCLHAMNVALDEKKTTWSYVRAILKGYREDGVKCLADIQRREKQRGKNRPKEPERKNKGFQKHGDELSDLAKKAVRRALEEGGEL